MDMAWLQDLAVWVDEQIGDRRVASRFRKMVLQEGKRDCRKLKDGAPKDGKTTTQDEEFPPRRRMRLGEKYRFVSAIHDAECQDTTKIWRWFCRGKTFSPEDEQAVLYASVAIRRDALHQVKELRADQFQRILGIFADVAADLGVSPPEVDRPAKAPVTTNVPDYPAPLSVGDPFDLELLRTMARLSRGIVLRLPDAKPPNLDHLTAQEQTSVRKIYRRGRTWTYQRGDVPELFLTLEYRGDDTQTKFRASMVALRGRKLVEPPHSDRLKLPLEEGRYTTGGNVKWILLGSVFSGHEYVSDGEYGYTAKTADEESANAELIDGIAVMSHFRLTREGWDTAERTGPEERENGKGKPVRPRPKKKRNRPAKEKATVQMIEAWELRKRGLTLRAIVDALKSKYGTKAPSSPSTVTVWIEIADSELNPKARSVKARNKLPEDRRGGIDIPDDRNAD